MMDEYDRADAAAKMAYETGISLEEICFSDDVLALARQELDGMHGEGPEARRLGPFGSYFFG